MSKEIYVTTPLDYRSIKAFSGEIIEEMTLFIKPFGIEIRTDKAVYQVYKDCGVQVAERTVKVDEDTPWCVFPDKTDCRGCFFSYAKELSDGGCNLMKSQKR